MYFPSGSAPSNRRSARSWPSTTTDTPALSSCVVNGRPSSILMLRMSKYCVVAPLSETWLTFFMLYCTSPRSSDHHAVSTGRLIAAVTALASSKVMRGRRAHARHVESVTLGVKLGRLRRWNVFTPTRVPANLSVMYEFTPFTIDHAPIRNETPMNTPMSAKPLFSFCTRSCMKARRTASRNRTSGGFQLVGRDQPVAQRHDARGMGRDVGFVRHHHHRLALAVQVAEHLHDLLAGRGVEVARRLVG